MASKPNSSGDARPRLEKNSDDPLFWEPSLTFVRMACVGLLLGTLAYAGVI